MASAMPCARGRFLADLRGIGDPAAQALNKDLSSRSSGSAFARDQLHIGYLLLRVCGWPRGRQRRPRRRGQDLKRGDGPNDQPAQHEACGQPEHIPSAPHRLFGRGARGPRDPATQDQVARDRHPALGVHETSDRAIDVPGTTSALRLRVSAREVTDLRVGGPTARGGRTAGAEHRIEQRLNRRRRRARRGQPPASPYFR